MHDVPHDQSPSNNNCSGQSVRVFVRSDPWIWSLTSFQWLVGDIKIIQFVIRRVWMNQLMFKSKKSTKRRKIKRSKNLLNWLPLKIWLRINSTLEAPERNVPISNPLSANNAGYTIFAIDRSEVFENGQIPFLLIKDDLHPLGQRQNHPLSQFVQFNLRFVSNIIDPKIIIRSEWNKLEQIGINKSDFYLLINTKTP